MVTCIILIQFTSCKKESIVKPEYTCPTSTPDSIPTRLYSIYANGFFVFQKFYSIQTSGLILDSIKNYAMEIAKNNGSGIAPISYQYHVFMGPSYVDSAKVNGIKFKHDAGVGTFFDTTATIFSTPRTYTFFADTAYYDNINYTDNTLAPDYTGYQSLPDSVYYNADFLINVGARTNAKETEVQILYKRYSYLFTSNYLNNTTNSFTIPSDKFPYDWHKDKVNVTVILRNWSSIKINGKDYYFILENRYTKK